MSDIRKGVYVLPNLLTTASLFCGFYAIISALSISMAGEEDFSKCALAIVLAAVFDGMDGRVARKTRTASRFGVEYDSLCDLVSFGVAPALIMYTWALRDFHRVGWTASFLYLACGALRLARFNVQSQGIEKKFFQGLPIPMAAMIVAGSIMIWRGKSITNESVFFAGDIQAVLLVMTYLLAVLMVSSIPYRSFKTLQLAQKGPFYVLVIIAVAFVIFAYEPWWVLFGLGCAYLLSGPVEKYVLSPPVQAFERARERRQARRRGKDSSSSTAGAPADSEDENVHPIRKP